MELETARLIVIVGTAVGAVVWFAGLATLLKAARDRIESAKPSTDRFEVEPTLPPGTIVGEAEVEGHPEELSIKLAGRLAREGITAFGPVKILARDRHEVRFEPVGNSFLGFRSGRVRLTPTGSKTRIDYAIETATGGWLIGGWIALGLGLLALIVEVTASFAFVLTSPNPQDWNQSIQVIQIGHFLWPPFLFAYRARQPGRILTARMESLIHNLPYS